MLTALFLTDYWNTIYMKTAPFNLIAYLHLSIRSFYIFMTSQIKSQSSDLELAEWNVLLLIIKQYLEFSSEQMKKKQILISIRFHSFCDNSVFFILDKKLIKSLKPISFFLAELKVNTRVANFMCFQFSNKT